MRMVVCFRKVLGIRRSAVRGNDLPIYRLLCLGNIDKAESHFVSQSDSGGNPFQDLAIVRIERTHAYTFYVQGKILRFRRLVALAVERRSRDVRHLRCHMSP